jgi:hypothetical protein
VGLFGPAPTAVGAAQARCPGPNDLTTARSVTHYRVMGFDHTAVSATAAHGLVIKDGAGTVPAEPSPSGLTAGGSRALFSTRLLMHQPAQERASSRTEVRASRPGSGCRYEGGKAGTGALAPLRDLPGAPQHRVLVRPAGATRPGNPGLIRRPCWSVW